MSRAALTMGGIDVAYPAEAADEWADHSRRGQTIWCGECLVQNSYPFYQWCREIYQEYPSMWAASFFGHLVSCTEW
jgi:hypothetical protein